MPLLYILLVIIALVIDYFIAEEFSKIAEMKGHDDAKYFWYTFIFGIIGMLMVVALPQITTPKASSLPPAENLFAKIKATNTGSTVKRCPECGDIIKNGRCEMCGKEAN